MPDLASERLLWRLDETAPSCAQPPLYLVGNIVHSAPFPNRLDQWVKWIPWQEN